MPSTAAQILDAVAVVASVRANPNVHEADAAVRALAYLGRALERLEAPAGGVESVGEARHALITRELAGSIRGTVGSWPAGGDHLTDLAGVAVDLIGASLAVDARGLTSEQRWAGTVMVARAVEHCAAAAARFPPYAAVPVLVRVRRHELAGRLSKLDPPAAAAGAWLDRGVPASGCLSRSAADMILADAAVGLVTSLERELGNGTLHVYAVMAASAAAEILATHAALRLPDADQRSRPPAVNGWCVLQRALSYLDDGSRYSIAPASRVTEHAFAVTKQLRAGKTGGATQRSSLPEIRFAVTQLSRIADLVEVAVSRWAESGRLFARARVLPRSEDRAADVMANRVVVVKPSDVTAIAFAAGATARLSAALAVDLDRSANLSGPHPQPGLLAALHEHLRPELSSRDAHWAHGLAARIDVPPLTPVHSR